MPQMQESMRPVFRGERSGFGVKDKTNEFQEKGRFTSIYDTHKPNESHSSCWAPPKQARNMYIVTKGITASKEENDTTYNTLLGSNDNAKK